MRILTFLSLPINTSAQSFLEFSPVNKLTNQWNLFVYWCIHVVIGYELHNHVSSRSEYNNLVLQGITMSCSYLDVFLCLFSIAIQLLKTSSHSILYFSYALFQKWFYHWK